MIVETSAIVAIVFDEPERDEFLEIMDGASNIQMSAANYVEAGIVVDRTRERVVGMRVEQLIESFDIKLTPVTAEQARIARQAYRDFGKGSGHPAQLNFGDCFSYALALDTDEPLLYKGADFGAAGVRTARSATP